MIQQAGNVATIVVDQGGQQGAVNYVDQGTYGRIGPAANASYGGIYLPLKDY